MKVVSSVLLFFLLTSCLQEEKKEMSQLDFMVHKIQRSAFWQREYAWEVIKWSGKNPDSALFYEQKKDSVVAEYKFYNRLYDSMINLYENKK